jgi:two-component system OmpR family sensor kinase
MKRSLQRHLSLMLGSAILVASVVAAAASFGFAYFEARELQDDMLRQIAMLERSGARLPLASNTLSPGDRDTAFGDPESRFVIISMPADARPDWIPRALAPGFHTLSRGSTRVRLFVRDTPAGERTVVAQPTDVRDEIAINSALRILIPMLLLLPLIAWLIVHIVRNELAPITRISSNLDEQPANRPQPVADDRLPIEILPFVHAINRLLERVNQLMGQQRRFVADAAHELRSPLMALSVQAQNLGHASSLDAVRERLVPLREGIERARKLTEQLLSLARTQAAPAESSVIDVSVMARELIAEFQPIAEARGIDLGLEEIAPLFMRGSPDALRLILKNALENSLKYTSEGGEVTLRLASDDLGALIEVVDNGPGIPLPDRERVFDSFYRMSGAGRDGSGLGLAIAREAAARLGGTVRLHDPREGSGLVFRFRLGRLR